MPPHGRFQSPVVQTAVGWGLSVALGVSFGLSYGDPWSNHPQYIIPGLHLLSPDFLNNDWWVVETSHFHTRFTWLVAGLAALGILPWAMAIGNVMVIATTLVLIYLLARQIDRDRALTVWLVFLVLFIGLIRTRSIAVSFFFSPSLQPSTLATLGYVGAILYFVRRQTVLSGLFLALAGFFHTNYLILGFAIFGLAHLMLGRDQIIVRLVKQFALSGLILAVEIPNILHIIAPELPADMRAEASWIFMQSLSFHFLPTTFLGDFLPFIGWHLMALPHVSAVFRKPQTARSFTAIYLGFLAVIAIAAFLTTALFVDSIARLQTLRMASFSLMCAHLVIACVLIALFTFRHERIPSLQSPMRLGLSAVGALLVVAYFVAKQEPAYSPDGILMTGGVILAALFWWAAREGRLDQTRDRLRDTSTAAGAIGLTVLLAFSLSDDIRKPLYNLVCSSCFQVPERRLYDWVRTTPPDATFLVPPFAPPLEGFRLFGQRAIVVDWRGLPHRADEIMEWQRRMALASKFYNSLDLELLDRIARTYGADYVVLATNRDMGDKLGRPAYENKRYRVYRVPQSPESGLQFDDIPDEVAWIP